MNKPETKPKIEIIEDEFGDFWRFEDDKPAEFLGKLLGCGRCGGGCGVEKDSGEKKPPCGKQQCFCPKGE